MTLGNIIEHLPGIIPGGTIVVEDERHTFEVIEHQDGTTSTQYTYVLDKAPIGSIKKVRGVVDGRSYIFDQGTDYQLVDDDGDGRVDAIDFGVGDVDPDPNTTFTVNYRARPIIERYAESHATETRAFGDQVADVIESRQLNRASGDDLDRIGALFGELGKRRGRNDDEYRVFLRSIVQSFRGRGTVPGLKFAIAAGIGTSPENVVIDEDFEQVGYEIRIENVDTEFLSSVVNALADLADPSGVELLSAPIIVLGGDTITVDAQESIVVSDRGGLGAEALALDGSTTLG